MVIPLDYQNHAMLDVTKWPIASFTIYMYICMILYDHVYICDVYTYTCINMKIDIHILNVDMTININANMNIDFR